MPRILSVSRVEVSPAVQSDYLRTLAQLARVSQLRGRRLWLFRCADRPGTFLECSESTGRDTHRAAAEAPEDEQQLERRLRKLARYPQGLELWEEVVL